MTQPLSILAFEPYDRGSHRAFRSSLARHSRHRWRWLALPGKSWKWRMRLGVVELLDIAHRERAFDEPIDVVFVTSLMSAADLRALLPAPVRDVPLVLYMHENQATYPRSSQQVAADPHQRDAHFALTNLTSILAADLVLWNSRWNLDSFLDSISELLRHSPGGVPVNLEERVRSRSRVCWPPVEVPPYVDDAHVRGERVLHNQTGNRSASREGKGEGEYRPDQQRVTRVVWPHRWEHDKGPDLLLEIARQWRDEPALRWIILGEQFRRIPQAMATFQQEFADRIEHCGFVKDREVYWSWLMRADWVLSTARHEFFGMAVVEALLAGCLPWLPQSLSYPELLPPEARNISPHQPPSNPDALRNAIRQHLQPAVAQNAVGELDSALDSLQ